ncbi:MAG: polysaccharide biosynthesis tyrosine autokinase [Bacteroidales bacterium]|nr:polysaccharide biosynthesis tyrosine autokinase [Bacteroidales bacterium]
MNFDQSNISIKEHTESIDIKKFIFKILYNWYWFALSVFVALTIAYFINRYSIPIYKQSCYVLVQDKETSLIGGVESILEEQGIIRRTRRRIVENEIAVLKSYSLISKTIKSLNEFLISYYAVGRVKTVELYKSTPFTVILDTTLKNLTDVPINVRYKDHDEYFIDVKPDNVYNKKMYFGEWYRSKNFNFCILNNVSEHKIMPQVNYYFVINNLNKLILTYRSKLNITQTDKKSTVLEISTLGTVPSKEVDFLNKLIDNYVQENLNEKNKIAENTIYFVDQQLEEVTDSLKQTESLIKGFRQGNVILDFSQEGQLLYNRLTDFQKQKADLLIKKSYLEYLKKFLTSESSVEKIVLPSVMNIYDVTLNELLKQYIDYHKERSSYKIISTEKNPAIEMLNKQIEETRKMLQENVDNLINITQISINEIDKNLEVIKEGFKKLPEAEANYINLQRRYKLNDQIYTYLITKRAEAGIAKASNIPDNKIIDYANEETKQLISPKYSLNYTIALLIGLMVPIIIIILLDFFNNKILDLNELEAKTLIPIIGVIGHNYKKENFIVNKEPKSLISESFRILRSNMNFIFANKDSKCNTVSVTSSISEEGKTFISLNLASSFALLGKKTLLINMDLRRPKLHEYLGVSNKTGLTNFIMEGKTIDEIIIKTHQENLYFLPSGPIPPNPAEYIESQRVKNIIEQLKLNFDLIIFDTPPLALVTDPFLLSQHCDMYLFIVRHNYTTKNVYQFLTTIKKQLKEKLYIVVNDFKIKGYGYYYDYSYIYGYNYYYKKEGYYDDYLGEDLLTYKKLFKIIFPFLFKK